MSIYIQCPRIVDLTTDPPIRCEGEIPYSVMRDSDDLQTWYYGEPTSNKCSEGHILTADEFDLLAPAADILAQEAHYAREY